MRLEQFAPGEYYHICGRGVGGQTLFHDLHDFARFLFLILHFQSPTIVHNVGWYVGSFVRKGTFSLGTEKLDRILEERYIELNAFALMPNHFHLILRNLSDGVASVYMQRILTSYGKYFNAKYNKTGHVFQGPFQAIRIKNNTQLLHTSAYVHKNPVDIPEWKENYFDYPHSSSADFIKESRFGVLLKPDVVLKQFDNRAKYKTFLQTSTAKEHVPFLK